MTEITIMNKNTPVISASLEIFWKTNVPKVIFYNVKVLNKELCPICIYAGDNNKSALNAQTQYWFDKRFLNKARVEHLENILKDKKVNHPEMLHFATLTDQYWVRYSEAETWDDINFHHNAWNNDKLPLYKVLMAQPEMIAQIESLEINWESPDLCTNGMMQKKWNRLADNNIVLTKFSTQHIEIFKEILSTKVAQTMRRDAFIVPYELTLSDCNVGDSSYLFVDEDHELVPAWHIINYMGGKMKNESAYNKLVQGILEFEIPNGQIFIDTMITLDCVLCNYDRNQGNFGFIRDVNTGKFVGAAPLYDFGGTFALPKQSTTKNLFYSRMKDLYCENRIIGLKVDAYENFITTANFLTPKERADIVSSIVANEKQVKENKRLFRRAQVRAEQ